MEHLVECCRILLRTFEVIQNFILTNLKSEESASISSLQKLLQKPELPLQLVYFGQFKEVSELIATLQGQLELGTSTKLIENFQNSHEGPNRTKFDAVLKRSPDWSSMSAIGNVLGEKTENSTFLCSMSPATILNFKNAPIVTVDIKRCFSGLSRVLIPQRERLT